MPRSAVDATRFTATGPFANAGRKTNNPILKYAGPAPPGETPQQKVIRLREAARRARQIEVSPFDKAVSIGRLWADRLHRATVYVLVGGTVLATAYTCFAISDMLIYNSRKRKEWTEQQENKLLAVLEQAHQATAQGAATEEQLRLLKIENVVDATERERAAKGGTLQRAKSYWYSMYSNEKPEESEGQDTKAVTSDESTDGNSGVGVLEAVKEATQSRASSRAGESPTLQAIRNNHDRSGLAIEGGVFDKAGAEAVDRARTLPNRWRIWLQGK